MCQHGIVVIANCIYPIISELFLTVSPDLLFVLEKDHGSTSNLPIKVPIRRLRLSGSIAVDKL